MFSRYSFKTGSFFSLHPSLPAFLPFSLSSSFPAFLPFSLSPHLPPFPLSFLSFLENLLCSRHCVKRCASEGVSVFKEGLVWWRGKHSAPRPPSSPPSVCFSTLFLSPEIYWSPAAPVCPYVICGCSGITLAALRCCSRPAEPVICALWSFPKFADPCRSCRWVMGHGDRSSVLGRQGPSQAGGLGCSLERPGLPSWGVS